MNVPLLDIDGLVVGRHRELAELRAAVEAAERTGGSCTLIGGVPGVGKSTLIQKFGAEVASRNCIFAYGRCREGAPAPYAAIGDALDTLVRTMDATSPAERDRWRTTLTNASSSLPGVLAELVPGLTDLLGSAAPVPDVAAADARHRLHRAVVQLVSVTAQYRTVVLAVDDVQWADQDALLLLSETLAVAPRNVLVVGTYRSGDFDPRASGFATGSVHRLQLEPIAVTDIENLLAGVAGTGDELSTVAVEF